MNILNTAQAKFKRSRVLRARRIFDTPRRGELTIRSAVARCIARYRMSDPEDRSSRRNGSSDAEGDADERSVEDLAKELAGKLRNLKNRDELTDYAVTLLRESNEEASQKDYQQRTVVRASKGDAFNPVAFGIPLFVIGLVLCATGILVGPGLAIIAVAVLMVLYGIVI